MFKHVKNSNAHEDSGEKVAFSRDKNTVITIAKILRVAICFLPRTFKANEKSTGCLYSTANKLCACMVPQEPVHLTRRWLWRDWRQT